jgi:hypothetical protein
MANNQTSDPISMRALRQQRREIGERALATPPLREADLMRQIKVLLGAWYLTKEPEPEFIDGWLKVLSQFPGAIVAEAADAYSGVAAGHPKYPASAPALRKWCEARQDHYRQLAADPRWDAPPVRPSPSADDKAHVQAKLAWCLGGLARSMGRRAKEDERAEAEARLAILAAERARIEVSGSLKRNLAGPVDEQPPGDD